MIKWSKYVFFSFLLIMVLFSFSCSEDCCNIEDIFCEQIYTIEKAILEHPDDMGYVGFDKEVLISYFFLNEVSGIEGNAKVSDFFAYSNKAFNSDKAKWMRWYCSSSNIHSYKIDSVRNAVELMVESSFYEN